MDPETNKEKADKKMAISEVGNTVNEYKIKAANTIKSVLKEQDTKNEKFQCTDQDVTCLIEIVLKQEASNDKKKNIIKIYSQVMPWGKEIVSFKMISKILAEIHTKSVAVANDILQKLSGNTKIKAYTLKRMLERWEIITN
ncbi:hypothetical protein QLX08_005855 [Tetragonisca angustula]|uniref:Uncharacterized protein n=1 Tax=Tetragonisca angustula TaxID=166442 RepID=A0AAW0ZW81_9HYME